MKHLFLGIVVIIATAARNGSAATVDSVTGSLPRNLSAGEFTITVVIGNVTDAERTAASDDVFADQFIIKADGTEVAGTASEPDTSFKFFFEKSDFQEDPDDSEWTFTFEIRIAELHGKLGEEAEDGSLELDVAFYIDGELEDELEDKTITQSAFVANEAPVITGGLGLNTQLNATWTHKDTITTVGDSSTAPATQVTVFAIPKGNDVSLPANLFDKDATGDSATTPCTYSASHTSNTGCITCADNAYIDLSQLPAGISTTTVSSSNGSATISGLENGTAYSVFLRFEPDGLQHSNCIEITPEEDVSLVELNGEGKAKVVNFRCFIATAAYGTTLHEDLDTLRDFRDRVLLKHPIGKRSIDFYYRHSPPLAKMIEDSPTARVFTRVLLWGPVWILKELGFGSDVADH